MNYKYPEKHSHFIGLAYLLIFIGEVKLDIGYSTLSMPICIIAIILPLFLTLLYRGLYIQKETLLLFLVVITGLISYLINSSSTGLPRVLVAMLPIIVSIYIIYSLSYIPIKHTIIESYIRVGAICLACAIICLSFYGYITNDNYYSAKLAIETPLGRSNYLSAFLLFAFIRLIKSSYFTSIILFVGIIMTLSRGGLIMLLLYFVIRYLTETSRLIIAISSMLLFMALLAIVLNNNLTLMVLQLLTGSDTSSADMLSLKSSDNRFLLWVFSLDLISKSFLWGVSPNGFRTAIENTVGMENVWGPHNSILLLWLNYGLAGMLLYSAYVYGVLYKLYQLTKTDIRYKQLFMSVIMLVIFGLFEPLVGSISFEVLFALIVVETNSALKWRQESKSYA